MTAAEIRIFWVIGIVSIAVTASVIGMVVAYVQRTFPASQAAARRSSAATFARSSTKRSISA